MDFQLAMRERQLDRGAGESLLRGASRHWQRLLAARPNNAQPRVIRPFLYLAVSVTSLLAAFLALRLAAFSSRALSEGAPAAGQASAAMAFLTSDTALILAFSLGLAVSLIGSIAITVRLVQPIFASFEEEHARLSAILGSIADGVVLRNPEGHIILANPAAVDLLTTGEGFSPEPLEALDAADVADGPARIEVGERTIGVSLATVQAHDGDTLGDVLVLRDVTREALAERTKDSFLDHIGHELRTPLTVIKGYVDLIRLGGDRLKPDVHERALSAILSQTDTLARMIDEIIDLTSMRSAGEQAIRKEPVDLNGLVHDTLSDWERRLTAAALTPSVTAEGFVTVEADPKRLRRALDALMDNACRFSPDGGPLRVSTRRVNGSACVSISDPGVGISEADLPRVFERFYRGDAVSRDGHPLDVRGVGQGLYAVKTIVEAHGGSIEVESAAGSGSTFTIWLPAVQPSR